MAKKIRRIFAICLALCLFVTVLPVNALAADTTETTVEGGITTTVETTTTTTEEGGKTTVTVIIDTTKTGTDESGADVNYQETRTETTITEELEDGTVIITEQTSANGSEVKEWDEIPEGLEVPEMNTDVTVELIPGKETQNSASDSATFTEGDTEYTVTVDKHVSAETSKVETTVITKEYDLEALAPEDYEGKTYHNGTQYYVESKDRWYYSETPDGLAAGSPEALQGYADAVAKPDAPGYDFQWTGYAESTNAVRAEAMDIVFAKDPITGEPIVDADGNYVIEKLTYTGRYNDGMGSTPSIFALTKYNEDGTKSYFYGYCIDNDTEAIPGSWYQVSNLEDSDYYPTEDAADVLRAVVLNGYWGQEEGMGSLAQMKEKLLAYYNEDSTVFIKDKNGNMVEYNVYDVLDRLTEADALAATQAAIWSNSNGTLATKDGQDGSIITGIYSVVKPKPYEANTDRDWDYERDAILQATYEWLMSLEGMESDTVIINDQNFVEDMELVVGDKVAEPDETGENDVYEAAVNFTLAFIPTANDDLLMQLKYIDADGTERVITKRLAGTVQEGETAISPNEDGSYTIEGLKLSENQEFTFDLHLDGIQHLEQGVYIYKSYVSDEHPESQTMVGISEGKQEVSVKASMTVSFSVDEKNNVVAVREWSDEGDPVVEEVPPVEEEEEPEEEEEEELPPPPIFEVNVTEDTIEIPEEPVPLADAPKTGSNSIIWIALTISAAMALAATCISDKKQHNTF